MRIKRTVAALAAGLCLLCLSGCASMEYKGTKIFLDKESETVTIISDTTQK